MQELGLSRSNPQLDAFAIRVERAHVTAFQAALKADHAHAAVDRLSSEIRRHGRRVVGSIIGVVVLAAFFSAGAWWAHGARHEEKHSLEQVASLNQSVDSLNARLASAEDALSKVPDSWSGISARMTSLEKKVKSGRPSAAAVEIAKLHEKLIADDAKIASLDSQLRSRRSVDRTPVSFVAAQNKSAELMPGVYLNVTKINVRKQQISGWVYLSEERRTVLLHNHALLEPIPVRSSQGNRAPQIVLTHVSRGDVSGYLLVPLAPVLTAVNNNN